MSNKPTPQKHKKHVDEFKEDTLKLTKPLGAIETAEHKNGTMNE